MPRDYHAEYERREELAIERGYDSFNEQRNYRDDARDFFESMGIEPTNSMVADQADMFHEGISEGEHDLDWYKETFEELYGEDWDYDEDAFWEWLTEVYKHG